MSQFLMNCVYHGHDKYVYSRIVVPLLPLAFQSLEVSSDSTYEAVDKDDATRRQDMTKSYRVALSSIANNYVFGEQTDVAAILSTLREASQSRSWQVRMNVAHFVRCFYFRQVWYFTEPQHRTLMEIVATVLLADARREVSSAAMAALTGILAIAPPSTVDALVAASVREARRAVAKSEEKSPARKTRQRRSVFSLCAAVSSKPYDTPPFVPLALEALVKHSFERHAAYDVREVVKRCFADYKRTHVDDWGSQKKQFTRDQLEAMEDVVSTPHYYA